MDTSIGAYGTLQVGDQEYGLISGDYDLHIGTCASCQDGQEYIDVFVSDYNNPWEMTWEILDSNGNVVTSGDGYTEDGCYDVPCPYTINMYDSQNNGWGSGNIAIGDQTYTVYDGFVTQNGVNYVYPGDFQSATYNDCISESCENTNNGAVDEIIVAGMMLMHHRVHPHVLECMILILLLLLRCVALVVEVQNLYVEMVMI